MNIVWTVEINSYFGKNAWPYDRVVFGAPSMFDAIEIASTYVELNKKEEWNFTVSIR